MRDARCAAADLVVRCTDADHEALRDDPAHAVAVLVNMRAWPGSGLWIGECPACRSTVALPLDEAVEALHRRDPLTAGGGR